MSKKNASTPVTTKRASISLRANGATMRLVAVRRAKGTASTFVQTKDGRGMSARHADWATALAVLETNAAAAVKLGWVRRVSASAPDTFDTLPAPPVAKKAGK